MALAGGSLNESPLHTATFYHFFSIQLFKYPQSSMVATINSRQARQLYHPCLEFAVYCPDQGMTLVLPILSTLFNIHRRIVTGMYSEDSIKHTVLLKVLLQIFHLVSIWYTVHWIFSRHINFVSLLSILFSIFQKLVRIHSTGK